MIFKTWRAWAAAAGLAWSAMAWGGAPSLKSPSWAALDEQGIVVAGAGHAEPRPIASITKLMMAMAYLDAGLDLAQKETISPQDVDRLKNSSSRLRVGSVLSRSDLLRLALASSENRAASALARGYPGGTEALVAAMNAKAVKLGLASARFIDPTGLNPGNVASARDVALLALGARSYAKIRDAALWAEYGQEVELQGRSKQTLLYKNTNKPLREGKLAPVVSKTGYIKEAGRCLAWVLGTNRSTMSFALLGAPSSKARDADEIALSAWAGGKTAKSSAPTRKKWKQNYGKRPAKTA